MSYQKWHSHSGLEHHCPVCSKPLKHPSAVKTCWGSHAVVCWRFHYGLHMRGHSHECKPCRDTDERHETRHREIAKLVRELKGGVVDASKQSNPNTPFERASTPQKADRADGDVAAPTPMTKKERKEKKRISKALERNVAVTTQDVQLVWKVLHPGVDKDSPLSDDEAAMAYSRADEIPDDEDITLPDFADDLRRILQEMKVEEGANRPSKEGKATLAKLTAAILGDLEQFYRECIGIAIRREGYRRRIGRNAAERELEKYEERDWRTGAKVTKQVRSQGESGASAGEPVLDEEEDEGEAPAMPSSPTTAWRCRTVVDKEGVAQDLEKVRSELGWAEAVLERMQRRVEAEVAQLARLLEKIQAV
ncbi:hypothetical protein NA57DRAFT_52936 [Rhizodiscina lignyota]|uniref:Uncharacterized protein n=1 Tax=Rhizodiscina lignyota TaxID=1504668 RepID=A0A9P4IKW1_9PEZI|nr:hypothetical protein NA57DRAFT_52936 [Rhizodiscina lignyota]